MHNWAQQSAEIWTPGQRKIGMTESAVGNPKAVAAALAGPTSTVQEKLSSLCQPATDPWLCSESTLCKMTKENAVWV